MKVVVTGGAGFIGANLCRALGAAGVGEVLALDDLSTGHEDNLDGSSADLFQASILDADALDSAFNGADAVVHLAARPSVPKSIVDPLASHHANTTGTAQVLEAARRAGHPHLIVASSSSIYGGNPVIPKSEGLRPMPLSPYAATKLATETYALAWAHSFNMKVLTFRFFNVFGPLQRAGHAYSAVVPAFVSAALEGMPLPVHGDGRQTRDFTFVGTVTEVITDAVARRLSSPEPVNLAFGSRSSLLDVIQLLEELLGHPLARQHLAPRPGDVHDSQADQCKLRAMFPTIEPTPLVEGLRHTVSWFRAKK